MNMNEITMKRSTEVNPQGKPIVKFDRVKGVFIHPLKIWANLFPLNHPDYDHVSNKKLVTTSAVVDFTEKDGRITSVETANTIYVESD